MRNKGLIILNPYNVVKIMSTRNFANFLSNGQNNERMIEIIFSTLQEKKRFWTTKPLKLLNQLIISKQNHTSTWTGNIDLFKSSQESLLVFHGFTVNDHVSTFFKSGKAACLKTFLKQSRFEKTFSMLGSNSYLNEKIFFDTWRICCYGHTKTFVNTVLRLIFKRKQGKKQSDWHINPSTLLKYPSVWELIQSPISGKSCIWITQYDGM